MVTLLNRGRIPISIYDSSLEEDTVARRIANTKSLRLPHPTIAIVKEDSYLLEVPQKK
jgi:hypothetical protein